MHGSEPLNQPLAGEMAPPADPARPAMVLLCASVFELIAASVLCSEYCEGTNAYAVSAGAVSTAVSLLVLVCLKYDDVVPPQIVELVPHVSGFLFMWWLPAWLTFTFVRPFAGLCNGFFACWAALVASIWLMRCHLPVVDGFVTRFVEVARSTLAEKAYVTALMVTSTFVWIEAAVLYSLPPYDGYLAWTIAVGVVSSVVCFAFLAVHDQVARHSRHIALALLTWWMQGLVISFVPTAFTGSVNGFVSVWLSLFLAAYFAFGSHSTAIADEPAISQYGPVGAASQPQPFMSPDLGVGGGFQGFGGGSTNLQPPPTEVGSGI